MRRDLLGRKMKNIQPDVGQDGSMRAHTGLRVIRIGRRAAAVLYQRCARFGDCIRSSTEIMGRQGGPEQRAAAAVPWLGLLLWMFACAALFVSLVMRADDLNRERRVAARSVVNEELLDRAHPMSGLTQQASGLNLFTVRRPPTN